MNSTPKVDRENGTMKSTKLERDASSEWLPAGAEAKKRKQVKEETLVTSASAKNSAGSKTVVHDSFSMTADLEDVKRPLSVQGGQVKEILMGQARKSFEKLVPYVFSHSKVSDLNIVFDVAGIIEHAPKIADQKKKKSADNSVWEQSFSGATFFAFLDERSPAIKLGTINNLREKGIVGEVLLSELLIPTEWPQKTSQVLYLFLSEKKILGKEFKAYEERIRGHLGHEEITWEKEELLIDFAGSSSSRHLKTLLEDGVSPDAFSALLGVYAIHVAKGSKSEDNVQLLLKYGADPTVKPEEPAV